MSFSPLYNSKTILSSAQLLLLNSNPVQLVSGIAGHVPNVQSVYYRYLAGVTPYNPNALDRIGVYITGTTINGLYTNYSATGWVDQSVDMSVWDTPSFSGNGVYTAVPLSNVTGQGISITQFRSGSFPTGANWTQGNGQLVVFLRYEFISLS